MTDTSQADLDKALEAIEDEPEEELAALEGDEAAAETPSGDEEDQADKVEPDEHPAIEPPLSWGADAKAHWGAIPADAQRAIAQHEAERNAGYNSKLQEAAEIRKAAEATHTAVQKERASYAQALDFILSRTDPILEQGTKTNWAELAQNDPSRHVALRQQYDDRVNLIRAAVAERQQLAVQDHQKALAASGEKLAAAIPEWKNEEKRATLQNAINSMLQKEYGYTAEELGGLSDYRAVLVARDALAFRRIQDARKSAEGKKSSVSPTKTLRSGSGQSGISKDERIEALKQRAVRTGREQDQLSAILSVIGN